MCMQYVSEIEKNQENGWKVVDIDENGNTIKTPFKKIELVINEQYLANGRHSKGIYVFLNKSFAKKYMIENVRLLHQIKRALLKVRLGNHIWKGLSDSFTWRRRNNHFYTTDSITPLEIEMYD